MNFKKNLYTISISAAMLAVAGCGITPQDEGLGDGSATPMSGVVVDGYLAGAVVYVDVNENNKLDAWEKRALTDTKGYFSYRPATTDQNGNAVAAINYCELPETDSKFIHCLKAPSGYDEVIIRMTKGYDLATAEPFTGTISMKVNVSSSVIDTPMVATPVTGLLSEMSDEQRTQFLADEGLTSDEAASDFLNFDNSLTADQRRAMLNIALKAHKVADVIASLLDPLYAQNGATGFFGVEEGVPTDGSVYVYRAIASQISSTNKLSDILSDPTKLTDVISEAVTNMNGVISDYNDRLPHDLDTDELTNPEDAFVAPTLGFTDISGIANKALKIADTIETVFGTGVTLDEADQSTLSSDVISRIRAIDAVVSLTRDGEAQAAVDNAVSLAGDAAYLANLRFAGVDMVSLKKKFVINPGAVVAADADYSSRKSFDDLIGQNSAFTPSDPNGTVNPDGFAGNTLDLSKTNDGGTASDSVKVDFTGDSPDAESGSLTIDATLLDGDFAKTDETGEPAPLELEGTWEKIDDYTMLMNIEVTDGVFEPVIVKPNEDGSGYYFDLGGEQIVWNPGS